MSEVIVTTGFDLGFEGVKELEGKRALFQFTGGQKFDADSFVSNVTEPSPLEWEHGIVAKLENEGEWPTRIYDSTILLFEKN